jgi:hypothetical protein
LTSSFIAIDKTVFPTDGEVVVEFFRSDKIPKGSRFLVANANQIIPYNAVITSKPNKDITFKTADFNQWHPDTFAKMVKV